MKLTTPQIQTLARMAADTRPAEITCDEWLDMVGRYAELVFAGKAVPGELQPVAEHLRLCSECTEEIEALLRVLAPG